MYLKITLYYETSRHRVNCIPDRGHVREPLGPHLHLLDVVLLHALEDEAVAVGPLPLDRGLRLPRARAHARVVDRVPLPPLLRVFAGEEIRPDDGRSGVEAALCGR